MPQESIPKLEWPKAFSKPFFIEDMAKAQLACMRRRGRTYDRDNYKSQPLSIRTAWAFLDWQGDLNDIVTHLNIVTSDLATLAVPADLPGGELWARYRLLVRTALNEFYRVKEVSDLFYKELKKLALISEPDRRGLSQMMRDLLGKLIEVRNHVTHVGMHVIEEERRAVITLMVEDAGLGIVSKTTGEQFQSSSEIGEIAKRIGVEFATIGGELFTFLQKLNDEIAKWFVENKFEAG